MKKKLFLVVGRSNSGKDTLTKIMSEYYNIPIIVSLTDRPMRFGETEGIEHRFLTEKAFDSIIESEELLAYTKIENPKTHTKGYRYCVVKRDVDAIPRDKAFYIIDPNGIKYLKERYSDEYDNAEARDMGNDDLEMEQDMSDDFEDR